MLSDLLDVEVPVVAAVPGAAVGLGASLALLCDVVVAADGRHVRRPARQGRVSSPATAARWPGRRRWVRPGPSGTCSRASRSRHSDAAALGLVTCCVPLDELQATALAMAEQLAANPPLAVRYTKAALNQPLKRALLETVDVATPFELLTFLSADHAEAVTAAAEKRPGTYKGQ